MSTIAFYIDHFNLRERPFSLVPDPDFLYWGPVHRGAFAMMEYGLMTRAPITLITGEVGAGKTTLLHHLLRSVEDDVVVGMVANTQGDRGEILRWAMLALDQRSEPGETYVDLFSRFQSYLIEQYAAGKRVLLIFDEAQNLSREALEELRMFTNINSGRDELLQLVLVGQPELREIISAPDLTQFAQRVSANFHLKPMDAGGVADYIAHRLRVAGATSEIFTPEACRAVYTATEGVPRLVNKLCDIAMVYAFSADSPVVDAETVEQVIADGLLVGAPKRPAADTTTDGPLLLDARRRV
ncbi:ATPase [Roseivivax halodurans JCM 10272]|uniref:ATPase n=1 Tax=Roseivivax halodurans JCM 10272 TaxID=1449350 RepID=X7EAW0_9RHOB|nr:AAA family ATPase [Roseivivax halodurans]ETX13224.1 ATPase [Roseivivax halodurans JCM 10272]